MLTKREAQRYTDARRHGDTETMNNILTEVIRRRRNAEIPF